jgi:predicted type IV restriction endonuclease
MPAPQLILDLIERFERNKEAYKSGAYNETQVRREFIDPFFEALGWDVNNKAGNAEAYKDVIHEDAVKVGGVTKAPDYSFRIGGQRKFFVEAKQPSINIKDTPAPAFQVRRYAWSAKLPLSIVTDFDEFAVYDCRIKPDQTDKSDKARIKYNTCRQYAEKWDEIASVFSKDAILKGSFDKYAESNKGKRGTAEVDSAFLAEIENWREMLARNIALRNSLSVRELNDSVQRIIDRIIFLRIAEDRGIEDYGALRGICNGSNTYVRLQELFEKADDRYNSGLFHFRVEKGETEPPDRLTPSLVIDDKPLKDIFKTLYYPDSPYEFAVLPADILGQVYEQFLGRVIRLTSDHRAVVEDKPEVKKAGGVFYTPIYIVDYIVKNTVGKLLEGKTPRKAESLRILDPACGSGSFLLGAYQYLLDWHLRQYVADGPEKHTKAKRPALYSGQGGAWHLTTAERKRILLNNIYGVDIDHQAVEVTKLSLLLKVLEDETGETLNQQRKLFHERALPDLAATSNAAIRLSARTSMTANK